MSRCRSSMSVWVADRPYAGARVAERDAPPSGAPSALGIAGACRPESSMYAARSDLCRCPSSETARCRRAGPPRFDHRRFRMKPASYSIREHSVALIPDKPACTRLEGAVGSVLDCSPQNHDQETAKTATGQTCTSSRAVVQVDAPRPSPEPTSRLPTCAFRTPRHVVHGALPSATDSQA
jgi:hypothetical protein